MKKLLAFYVVASVVLFAAVFAGFTLVGIVTSEAPPETPTIEASVAEAPATLAPPPPPPLRHPNLPRGGMYQVAYATLISSSTGGVGMRKEYLPERGIFLVEDRLVIEDRVWYEITVSDGQRDYRMFLRAVDLNYTEITPYGPQPRPSDARYEALIASMEADLEVHQRQAEARRTREAEAQRSDLDRFSERVSTHVSAFSSSDWVRVGVQSSTVTLVILAFTTISAWLIARKRWENTSLREKREADADLLEDEHAEDEDALYPDSNCQQQRQQQQHAQPRVGTTDFDK